MSYNILGQYTLGAYSGGPTFAALFLMGRAVVAPTGCNLPAPMPVGQYGKWSQSGTVVKTASSQFPVRIGPRIGFVGILGYFRPGGAASGELPAYGN